MNEHFVTCTVTSLHKLALFVIVLVTALGSTYPELVNYCI